MAAGSTQWWWWRYFKNTLETSPKQTSWPLDKRIRSLDVQLGTNRHHLDGRFLLKMCFEFEAAAEPSFPTQLHAHYSTVYTVSQLINAVLLWLSTASLAVYTRDKRPASCPSVRHTADSWDHMETFFHKDTVYYYHRGDDTDREYFYIGPLDGEIKLRKSLQDTFRNQFSFTVQAIDDRPSGVQRVAEVTVTINVLRDGAPPQFQRTPYETTVAINQPVNTPFFSVLAVDGDLKGAIVYRLDGFTPATNFFGLDANSGDISVTNSLLANNVNTHRTMTLLVSAYDTGAPSAMVSQTVTITINRNLYSPVFSESNYETTIYDWYPIGSNIITISATDDDVTIPEKLVHYDIVGANIGNVEMFSINPVSGLITSNRLLTSDSASLYSLRLEAEDLGYPFRTGVATVRINVIRNNAAPIFTSGANYDVTINEDVAVLSQIVGVTATDTDEGINGEVFFTIVDSPDAIQIFDISREFGSISARISLLGTNEDIYRFNVRASDSGLVPRTADAQVTIRIQRGGLPYFDQTEFTVTIPEDTGIDGTVFNLDANEPRLGSVLVYDIIGEGDAVTVFRVSDATGLITLATSVLNNNVNSYVIRAKAYRQNYIDEFATALVRVFIARNIADPRFTHGNLVFTLSEDQKLGQVFGSVEAVDTDAGRNGIVRYSINGGTAVPDQTMDYFFISPTSGGLSVKTSLLEDLEKPDTYQFSVIAADKGVPSRSADILVTVNIIRNRNGPVFRATEYTEIISEFTSVDRTVLRVRADDADNHEITYSIIASTTGMLYFDVNPISGVISVNGDLTNTAVTEFKMTIQAKDNPGSNAVPRTATAGVTITVTRNPESPIFTVDRYEITISEYKPVQQSVIQTVATDADPDNTPSGTIVYSIQQLSYTPLNGFDQFVISQTEGSIYISQPLTRVGVPDRFELTIQASDMAAIPKSATATVIINIVRNRYPPIFEFPEYTAAVTDYWATGRELFVASATDNDTQVELSAQTPNAEFDYIIDPEFRTNAAKYFGVTTDGIVYIKQRLEAAGGKEQFEFYIAAIDRSWEPRTNRALVTIDVTYTGIERTLGFDTPTYYISVLENMSVNDPQNNYFLDIVNVDPTLLVRCEILYINGQSNFNNNNDDFTKFGVRTMTNGEDCEAFIVGNLDRETRSFWNITIGVTQVARKKRDVESREKRQATDPDYIQVYSAHQYAYLIITILDVNDNAPTFHWPTYPEVTTLTDTAFYIGAISMFAQAEASPVQLVATDPDEGLNGKVEYAIADRDSNGNVLPFVVDNNDGLITAAREFNFDGVRQYSFTATAMDSAEVGQRRVAETNVIVDIIENKNRFILVSNENIRDVNFDLEGIRTILQSYLAKIVLIEKVNFRRYLRNGLLSINYEETDITFVVVNHINRQFTLYENTNLDLVTEETEISQTVLANVKTALRSFGNMEIIRRPFESENVLGISDELLFNQNRIPTKSYVWWMNDPWAGFVAISGIIILLSIISLVILVYQWKRYSNYLDNYRVYHRNYEHQPDFTNPPSFIKEYETQTMDMYMPPDETVHDMGEINMSFAGGESARKPGEARARVSTRNPVYDNQYHVKYEVAQ